MKSKLGFCSFHWQPVYQPSPSDEHAAGPASHPLLLPGHSGTHRTEEPLQGWWLIHSPQPRSKVVDQQLTSPPTALSPTAQPAAAIVAANSTRVWYKSRGSRTFFIDTILRAYVHCGIFDTQLHTDHTWLLHRGSTPHQHIYIGEHMSLLYVCMCLHSPQDP